MQKDFLLFLGTIGVFALVLIANTIMGVLKSRKTKKFDWSIFFDGTVDYLLLFVAMGLIYIVGYILKDVKIVYDGTEYTIMAAIIAMLMAAVMIYVNKLIGNFSDYLKLPSATTEDIRIEDDIDINTEYVVISEDDDEQDTFNVDDLSEEE